MRDGPGRHSGGVSVYVSDRLHAHVELVKTAEDDDILQFQGKGADILVCGDINARTAEQDDYIRLAELPPCLDVPDEADDLPDYIQPRHNCDKTLDPSKTWGQSFWISAKTRVCSF
ncbi:TPA: hypothetical protein ACH3X3_005128 [Trebouxia sp. C0006]